MSSHLEKLLPPPPPPLRQVSQVKLVEGSGNRLRLGARARGKELHEKDTGASRAGRVPPLTLLDCFSSISMHNLLISVYLVVLSALAMLVAAST